MTGSCGRQLHAAPCRAGCCTQQPSPIHPIQLSGISGQPICAATGCQVPDKCPPVPPPPPQASLPDACTLLELLAVLTSKKQPAGVAGLLSSGARPVCRAVVSFCRRAVVSRRCAGQRDAEEGRGRGAVARGGRGAPAQNVGAACRHPGQAWRRWPALLSYWYRAALTVCQPGSCPRVCFDVAAAHAPAPCTLGALPPGAAAKPLKGPLQAWRARRAAGRPSPETPLGHPPALPTGTSGQRPPLRVPPALPTAPREARQSGRAGRPAVPASPALPPLSAGQTPLGPVHWPARQRQ